MRPVLSVLSALFVLGGASAVRADEQPATVPDFRVFLRDAVFDGLKADAMPPNVAGELLRGENWIGKCQLCTAAKEGFDRYLDNTTRPLPTKLPKEMIDRLRDPKADIRLRALNELVNRYVEQHYARLQLSKEVRAALQKKMQEERANGMAVKSGDILPNGTTFCPSCNGACLIGPPPTGRR
jgi:hypothetical protein